MLNQFSRTELLLRKSGYGEAWQIPEWLYSVSAVWAVMSVEALVRSGVGHF